MIRRGDLAVGSALAGVLVGPAALRGGWAGTAELYGHAWVQGWVAAGWPAWRGGTDLALGTEAWPVVDPIPTWLAGGLSHLVSPAAAWNLLVASGIVLAAAGGGALARAARGVGLVGAVGLAPAPIFLGSLASGLTEDAALGLVALALAAQLHRRWGLAGALLALAAGCGLVLGMLGGLAALGIGAVQLVRARNGRADDPWGAHDDAGGSALARTGRGLALAGALALAGGLVAAWPHRANLGVDGRRAPPAAAYEPAWRTNPVRGADLASFVAPREVPFAVARPADPAARQHPVYLGWITLALAVAGGPELAWAGVLGPALLAPGPEFIVAGKPTGIANPVDAVVRAVPFLGQVHHRARWMLLGQMGLVVLAARGAARLAVRWPVVAQRAPLAILLETLFFSPAPVPLPSTPDTHPAIYTALASLPPGPVSVAGAAGPGISPQRVFFDQVAHGRKLLHDPNRPRDGTPRKGALFVVLGGPESPARQRWEAELGPPEVVAEDGVAWASAARRAAARP